MKKTGLFVWLLCVVSMSALAQVSKLEYRPFAEDGKVWEIQFGGIKENLYVHSIDGDTLINGEDWKKVYNSMYMTGLRTPSYYAAVRDVGKKVYAIAKGTNRPRLLYDFGLKEGEIVMCGIEGNTFSCLLDKDEREDSLFGFVYTSFLRVERIDTITDYSRLQYRRFILSFLDSYQEPLLNEHGYEFENVVWIEGIGSAAGPFSPCFLLPPRNRINQHCYVNKECVFSNGSFYENSEPAAIGTALYNKDDNDFIHDLQGRRLSAQPTKGVYIQNGKKVVVK